MNEENILEDLRKELRLLDEELSRAYNHLEEAGAEVAKLEYRREELIIEIKEYKKEIVEINEKKPREEIDDLECGVKCLYYKNPSACEKKDKSKCPYTQQQLKLEKWVDS